jgi:uncharacterized membrane protein YkvA (DUF1232 family)
MKATERWKARASRLKKDTYAIYLACRDRRTPWYARVLGVVVAAYALSPVDLIPDAIPVLGYLDDLLLVPLGVALVLRMIPPQVMADCREKAAAAMRDGTWHSSWLVAAAVISLWLALLAALVVVVSRPVQH